MNFLRLLWFSKAFFYLSSVCFAPKNWQLLPSDSQLSPVEQIYIGFGKSNYMLIDIHIPP